MCFCNFCDMNKLNLFKHFTDWDITNNSSLDEQITKVEELLDSQKKSGK